jgi:hypothetical protein
MLAEYDVEGRHGLEAALRRYAVPPRNSRDSVSERAWLINSSDAHRGEVSRTDRVVCALLADDFMSAAHYVETAGPVGAALVCLRSAVVARRLRATRGDSADSLAAQATQFRDEIARDVLVPASDRRVWKGSYAPATRLFEDLTRAGTQPTSTPLVCVSRALAPRSLLSRRAFATTFCARLAALQLLIARADGVSREDCIRQQAALTIAYLAGGAVELASGRLHLGDDPNTDQED